MNARLLEKIKEDCAEVDVDALFDEMIDGGYSFEAVGGPFKYFSPSRVLREMDPTAARCGTVDYVDSLQKDGEIDSPDNGNTYYRVSEMDAARDELVSEMEQEATDVAAELKALEDSAEELDLDEEREAAGLKEKIESIEKELEEIRDCALNA